MSTIIMEVSIWLLSDRVPIFVIVIMKFRIFATPIMNPCLSQKMERVILLFFLMQSTSACADLLSFTVNSMQVLMIFEQAEQEARMTYSLI